MKDRRQEDAFVPIWLGQVPSHWHVKALKFCADLINERVSGSEAESQYIGLEHIEGKTGRLVEDTDTLQGSADSTVSKFEAEDVLFGKLRPYLAKSVVAASRGVCSPELLVFRPHALIPEYLKHVLLLDGFIAEVNASTFGSKMPRAEASFIARLPVPVPSIDEQVAIVARVPSQRL